MNKGVIIKLLAAILWLAYFILYVTEDAVERQHFLLLFNTLCLILIIKRF